MDRIMNRVNWSLDPAGLRMVRRRNGKERRTLDCSIELQRKLILAQQRRHASEAPVTLPRVMWLERPEVG